MSRAHIESQDKIGPASREARARVARCYQAALRAQTVSIQFAGGKARLAWHGPGEGAVAAAEMLAAVQPGSGCRIKHGPRISVFRVQMGGVDVLVKQYRHRDWISRLRSAFRPSRARRAWAAAQTFLALGQPTPEPLGFLETGSRLLPSTSYFLCAFLSDTIPARRWIKNRYHLLPDDVRASFRGHLLDTLLALYRTGLYHADTKASNLLVRAPDDPLQRTFYWIDLESARCGVRLSRRKILRNLVQLNGSLGRRVSEEDRFAFLHELARTFPWLARPAVAERIRRWTRRRLEYERDARCGP